MTTPSLPNVQLKRAEWIRMVVVSALVVLAVIRVAPDLIRAYLPLQEFGYVTDADGTVVTAHRPGAVRTGDRIRVDRIKPFDRKGGIVGEGYTYDNPDRTLQVERAGRLVALHLKAHPEKTASRVFVVLRIAIFLTIVVLGAILFLVQPSIASGAILAYCLASEGPSTWLALQIPNPWRQAFDWYAATSIGVAGPALLLFASTLLFGSSAIRRRLAWVASALAIALGSINACRHEMETYVGAPAATIGQRYAVASEIVTWITIATFFAAFVRARGDDRRRIGWIVAAFAFASVARLASDSFYPGRIPPWINGLLLTTTVLPILVVWLAVIRDRFFSVDFVVSRAVLYVAVSAAVLGAIFASEEIGTYVFMQNTDLAYGFYIAITIVITATTGKLRELIEAGIDRFIFRDRLARRHALELIAGYVLDAETVDQVERALLEDATHALHLSFAGILNRDEDGTYRLGANYEWPPDCLVELHPTQSLLKAIQRTRGTMRFTGKDTRLINTTFGNERLTFAAPLFFDRKVNAIVVYGSSRIGLDLDTDERESLIEVVAHASIALHAIELAHYRAALEERGLVPGKP